MDCINIKNLEVFAKHGVFPEENALGQKFIVSVSLFLELRTAGKADELTRSLDYGTICREIKSFVEDNTFKLLETVAEGLAERLLLAYSALKTVRIEIQKPWAPVGVHLQTVSVEIERGRHTAYIALGSNIGDRNGYLSFAAAELDAARGCRVVKASEFINTAPYGVTEQDDFLNGCLELETLLTPHELLELLHAIEQSAGRERKERWGPRTLDLDIIFFDDLILSDADLRLPHPDAHNREFVLEPLRELAPWYIHPALHKTIEELIEELRRDG